MEIELSVIIVISVASCIAGIGAMALYIRNRDRSPMILRNNAMKKLGLPYVNDKRFSHIFTYNKKRRMDLATKVMDEVIPLIASEDLSMTQSQDAMEDSRLEISTIQKKMEKMRTQGEDESVLMGLIAPELYRIAISLKEIEYALASKTMFDMQRVFMKQVAKGCDKEETMRVMESKIEEFTAPDMDMALKIYREAIALAPSEYQKTMKKWINPKE